MLDSVIHTHAGLKHSFSFRALTMSLTPGSDVQTHAGLIQTHAGPTKSSGAFSTKTTMARLRAQTMLVGVRQVTGHTSSNNSTFGTPISQPSKRVHGDQTFLL